MEGLRKLLDEVFGMDAPFADAWQPASTGTCDGPDRDVRGWIATYAAADHPWQLAMEQACVSLVYADTAAFLTHALLVEIPYRHEALWQEIEPPHTTWHYDGEGGWSTARGAEAGPTARFRQRWSRFRWIASFFSVPAWMPTADPDPVAAIADGAFDTWLSDLDAPEVPALEALVGDPMAAPACDALAWVLGLYLLGEDERAVVEAEALADHRARIVRSASKSVIELAYGDGPFAATVTPRRDAFVARVRGQNFVP